MRKDGTSTTKLYDGYCSSINVIGDWIYFSNDYRLCKIKTNGTEYAKRHSKVSYQKTSQEKWLEE